MKLLKSYYILCKPNVVYMMLICALVGMLLAEDSVSSVSNIIISLLGIALCSGSAAAINQVVDRKADASMTRTDQRPLPQGELSPFHASCFAFVIGLMGALILYFFVNTLTMLLTLASLIGYAFIYTIYLKRATPQNIVIGGLAGAAPPLLGWTAIVASRATAQRDPTSVGSPKIVPVPCASITDHVDWPERASAARMRPCCAIPLGAERLALRPSARTADAAAAVPILSSGPM